MSQILEIAWGACLAITIVFLATSIAAQETVTSGQVSLNRVDSITTLNAAEIQTRLEAIEADAGIEDVVKERLRSKYKQAIEVLDEAANFSAQAVSYKESIITAPDTAAELRDQLKILASTDEATEVPSMASVDDIQKDISLRRATLSKLNDDLSNIRSELGRVKERPFEISSRLPENQRELSEIRKQLESPQPAEETPSPVAAADRILLEAKLSRLLSEWEMLKQEQLSQSVREDLIQAQYELVTGQVANAAAAVASSEEMLKQRLAKDATRFGSVVKTIAEEVPENDEAAQALAVEVQSLAKEFEDVIQGLEKAKAVKNDLVSSLEHLDVRNRNVREQLALSGGGIGMAQILLDMLRDFPNQMTYVKGLSTQLPPLDEMRLAFLKVEGKIRNQSNVESQFSGHPSEAVARLVTSRRNVLEKMRTQYGNLIRELAIFDGVRLQYVDKAKNVQSYVAEQLFGFRTRSAPPIGMKTFTDIPGGLRWFIRSDHWLELGRSLLKIGMRQPILCAFLLLITTILIVTRPRVVAALENTGIKVRRVTTDKYAYTSEGLLWTFLLAIPIPLLIGFMTWMLQREPEPSGWLQGITIVLPLTTWLILMLAFLSEVCRSGGLGEKHFRWQEKQLSRVRHAIRLFAIVYIPALIITYSGLYRESPEFLYSVGRLCFMIAQVWTTFILWRLFQLSDGILTRFIEENPSHLIARWKYIWVSLILALPVALAIIAGQGYIITAIRLNSVLIETAGIIVSGVLLYWCTRRWFRFKQRKLALAEELERKRLRHEAAALKDQNQPSDIVTVDPEDEEKLNLLSITKQTNYLLRSLFSLGVAVAIFLLWSNNFQLFTMFDSISLPLVKGLTLSQLVQASLVVILTYILVRNLPGFLELAILRATTINAGTRNAISTLCQYAVIAIGLSLLFNILQVDWAKLGWIAAALSVGIGFGLQEVVANFVCGLIVLFERPIAVGDVVTVGGVTGTVTKIRIRATTITNADRQDFVVPNKNLITNSLLNWTMTAKLNRVVIRVSIHSENDPDKARQLLTEIADDHPAVLDDPAPMATFEQFGDSTIDLVLYAFLPDLESRTNTITELNTEINKRFSAASIEIPNPQFDINIRSNMNSGLG